MEKVDSSQTNVVDESSSVVEHDIAMITASTPTLNLQDDTSLKEDDVSMDGCGKSLRMSTLSVDTPNGMKNGTDLDVTATLQVCEIPGTGDKTKRASVLNDVIGNEIGERRKLSVPNDIFEDWDSYIFDALKDLEEKQTNLRNQLKALTSLNSNENHESKLLMSTKKTKLKMKSYIDCQLLMLNRHIRQLKSIKKRMEKLHSTAVVDLSNESKTITDNDDKVDDCDTSTKLNITPHAVVTTTTNERLLNDLSFYKRRCKRIIDITDQYCVVYPDEIGIPPKSGVKVFVDIHQTDSENDVPQHDDMVGDGRVSMTPTRNFIPTGDSHPLSPVFSSNIGRRTVQSIAGHLSVLIRATKA